MEKLSSILEFVGNGTGGGANPGSSGTTGVSALITSVTSDPLFIFLIALIAICVICSIIFLYSRFKCRVNSSSALGQFSNCSKFGKHQRLDSQYNQAVFKPGVILIIAVLTIIAVASMVIASHNTAIAEESSIASISEKVTANVDDSGNVTFSKGVIKNTSDILAIGVRKVESKSTVDLSDSKLSIFCNDKELYNKTLGEVQLNEDYVTVPFQGSSELSYTISMPVETAQKLIGTSPVTIDTYVDLISSPKGLVVDESNGPVYNATITYTYIDSYTKEAVTKTTHSDSNGKYEIPNLPEGTVVNVVVEKDGSKSEMTITADEGESAGTSIISKYAIEPEVSSGLVYNGEVQLGVNGGVNITLSGDRYATEAGTYTAYATPNSGFTWKKDTTSSATKTYTWSIAKAINPHPTAPSESQVVASPETLLGKGDGKITGVEEGMEYSSDGGKTWISVKQGQSEITPLSSGTYLVRYEGDNNHEPSDSLTVTINGGQTTTLTYDSNGASSGSVPTDSTAYSYNGKATVLGKNDLIEDGKSFEGWNTKKDGSGDPVAVGSTYSIINANPVLYAVWVDKLTPTKNEFTYEYPSGAKSRTYDAKNTPATAVIKTGVEGIGTPVIYYSEYSANDWSTTPPKDVGNYKVKIEIPEADRYTYASLEDDNWDFQITKVNLTVSTTSPSTIESSKTYDGSTNCSVTPGQLVGVVGSEAVNLSANAQYDSSHAGIRIVTITYTISGADIANYEGPTNGTATGTITQKPLEKNMLTIIEPIPTYTSKTETLNYTVKDGELLSESDYSVTGDSAINVEETTLVITAKSDGNYSGNISHTWQLKKAANSHTSAPAVTKTNESLKGAGDGAISGVESGMEYSSDGGNTWKPVPEDKTEVTPLTSGEYIVRWSGDDNHEPSPSQTVTIAAGPDTTTLTYEANGGEGTVPTDSNNYTYNSTATVMDGSNLKKDGQFFAGWNTLADGTGVSIAVGAKMTILYGNPTLYAMFSTKQVPSVGDFTVTVPPSNLTYDKTTKPATASSTQEGIGSYTVYYYKDGETIEDITTDAPINAGTYYVVLKVEDGEKYTSAQLVNSDWKYTISPKEIDVTSGVTATDRTYDATNDVSVVTSSATFTPALCSEDVVTVKATGSMDNKKVGNSKTVNITYSGLDGASASNYSLKETTSRQKTTTVNIAAASLTVKANSTKVATTKVYDGTADVNVENVGSFTEGDVKGTDSVTLGATAKVKDSSVNVATDKPVTVTYTITGDDSTNYTTPVSLETKVTITAKAVTVSGITADKQMYNGTKFVVLNTSAATITGKIEGDTLAVSADAESGSMSDKNVGTDKNVTIDANKLSLGGDSSANYVLASTGQQASTTVTITKYQLEVVGTKVAASKTYDRTNSCNIETQGTLKAYPTTDNLSIASQTATYARVDVDTDIAVTVVYALGGTDASNYEIKTVPDLTASITQKQVNLAWPSTSTFTYDGTVKTFQPSIESSVISGDTVNLQYEDGQGGAATNASSTAYTTKVKGLDNSNYSLPDSEQCSHTWTINPIEFDATGVTVTVAGITDTKYTGSEIKPSPTSVTVVSNSKTFTLTATTDYSVSYDTSKDYKTVGTDYPVTITGAGNFSKTYTVNFNITTIASSISIAAIADQEYTGSEVKPTLTVTDNNTPANTLTLSTDYEASYSNNIDVTTTSTTNKPTATATGVNGYVGINATKTFNIVKAKYEVSAIIDDDTHGSVTVSSSALSADAGTLYTVSDDGNTITIKTGETTEPTIVYTQDSATDYELDHWEYSNDDGTSYSELPTEASARVIDAKTKFKAVTTSAYKKLFANGGRPVFNAANPIPDSFSFYTIDTSGNYNPKTVNSMEDFNQYCPSGTYYKNTNKNNKLTMLNYSTETYDEAFGSDTATEISDNMAKAYIGTKFIYKDIYECACLTSEWYCVNDGTTYSIEQYGKYGPGREFDFGSQSGSYIPKINGVGLDEIFTYYPDWKANVISPVTYYKQPTYSCWMYSTTGGWTYNNFRCDFLPYISATTGNVLFTRTIS